MYERSYLKQIKSRIEEPRKFIQVILGPRQVGKTTMVNQLLSQLSISYVSESADAIAATNSAWLMQAWELPEIHYWKSYSFIALNLQLQLRTALF